METLAQEKTRMLAEWDYYQKSNGEIDAVVNRRTLRFFYGSQAGFVLRYLRNVHGVQLLPIKEVRK